MRLLLRGDRRENLYSEHVRIQQNALLERVEHDLRPLSRRRGDESCRILELRFLSADSCGRKNRRKGIRRPRSKIVFATDIGRPHKNIGDQPSFALRQSYCSCLTACGVVRKVGFDISQVARVAGPPCRSRHDRRRGSALQQPPPPAVDNRECGQAGDRRHDLRNASHAGHIWRWKRRHRLAFGDTALRALGPAVANWQLSRAARGQND